MSKAAALLALAATCFYLQANAGPQLPNQEMNLAVLDLNDAPFRQFHLQHYPGAVLNPNAVVQTPRAPTKELSAHSLMIREITQESLNRTPGDLAILLPEHQDLSIEELLVQEGRLK